MDAGPNKVQSRSPLQERVRQRKCSGENVRKFTSFLNNFSFFIDFFFYSCAIFLNLLPNFCSFWFYTECVMINSWTDLFQIGQQWTLIMLTICWQKGRRAKRIQLRRARHQERLTRRNWQKPSTWTGPESWLSRISHLLWLIRSRRSSFHLLFISLNLPNPGDTFLRYPFF